MNKGYIVQVLGPVVDVKFDNGSLPAINNALSVNIKAEDNHNVPIKLVLEVANHMYERHTTITKFFITIGVPEDIALKDACKMEVWR